MKYRFLIVEDDPIISRTIKTTLEKNKVEVLAIAKNVEIALQLIHELKPDVCLVDIHLNDKLDGIFVAKDLDKLQIPYFYLTALTDPLTLAEVCNTNPLGYLVKPFTSASLWSSISVVLHKHFENKEKLLIIKSSGYLHKIPENQIIYLEAFDNYCYIHLSDKKILVPYTLKKTIQLLKSTHFFLIHRSYCVNTKFITKINNHFVTVNGLEISLSEARKNELLKFLGS